MESINLPFKINKIILALGAESAGVFAVYRNGSVFVSDNFGDLLDESNFLKYKKAALTYIKKEKIKPDIIITDSHPLFKTTDFGEVLAEKYNAQNIKLQHHIAHIFSSVGDKIIHNTKYIIPGTFVGIALDGTGYGLDGKIWGGEIFKISNDKFPMTNQCQNSKFSTFAKAMADKQITNPKIQILRIGSLEEQIMIGGDLAVREPARMLIAILAKLKIKNEELKTINKNLKVVKTKNAIYNFVKKFYTKNEFDVLYSQMEQGFNCQKTTSTGRVLDAVSVLLGFAGNERNYKHEAVKKLEENSTTPYGDYDLRFTIYDLRISLDTTRLFEYLIKNIKRDKKRLAATAQAYVARGLYEIIKKNHKSLIINHKSCIVAAGGMANNKIISSYLEKQGVYLSKKIPRGDEGIAVGQIIYYLFYRK